MEWQSRSQTTRFPIPAQLRNLTGEEELVKLLLKYLTYQHSGNLIRVAISQMGLDST